MARKLLVAHLTLELFPVLLRDLVVSGFGIFVHLQVLHVVGPKAHNLPANTALERLAFETVLFVVLETLQDGRAKVALEVVRVARQVDLVQLGRLKVHGTLVALVRTAVVLLAVIRMQQIALLAPRGSLTIVDDHSLPIR